MPARIATQNFKSGSLLRVKSVAGGPARIATQNFKSGHISVKKRSLSSRSGGLLSLLKTVFLIVFLVFVLGSGWKVYGAWRDRTWTSGGRITVVVAAAHPRVYSFSPQDESIIYFDIPKDTQFEVAGNYGEWLAGSLWGLGEQEKKRGVILQDSVQTNLGIPVDAWVDSRGEDIFEARAIRAIPALFKALKTETLSTNLTFFDRLSLVWGIGRVGQLSRRELDLKREGVLAKTVLSDGVPGYLVSPEKTTLVLDVLRDERVFLEAKTLKVTNASGSVGQAAQVSRIVSVLGLRVISVETDKSGYSGVCLVRGTTQNIKSLAASRLAQIFGCDFDENSPDGPVSLELIIGDAFSDRF